MRLKSKTGGKFGRIYAGAALALVAVVGASGVRPHALEEGHLGTFTHVRKRSTGDCIVATITAEDRGGGQTLITGTVMEGGKTTADIKGSYYQGSQSFKGTITLRENKKVQDIDGKFIPREGGYDLWGSSQAGRSDIVQVRRIDASSVEGTYKRGDVSLTIKRSGSGFEVSGTHYGSLVKGSYSLRSNKLSARTVAAGLAPVNIDGHFDPSSIGLCIWRASGGDRPNPSLTLDIPKSGAGPVPPAGIASGDPATKPGAIWTQSETHRNPISGTWTLDATGKRFDARWDNGAKATLTLKTCTDELVVVTRNDESGVSKGLKATYNGVRRDNKVTGTVDWTWADGKKGSGSWSATLPSR